MDAFSSELSNEYPERQRKFNLKISQFTNAVILLQNMFEYLTLLKMCVKFLEKIINAILKQLPLSSALSLLSPMAL
jgi:hypothetical protein